MYFLSKSHLAKKKKKKKKKGRWGPIIVAQKAKLLPETPASHLRVGSSPSVPLSIQFPIEVPGKTKDDPNI